MAEPLWSGRLSQGMSEALRRLSVSVPFDKRLYREDITGSLAHLQALEQAGVITAAERSQLDEALQALRQEMDAGTFVWDEALEDVHSNIERALTARLGDVAKKLHTGRSRNDQVATDTRLYLRGAIDSILTMMQRLREGLIQRAREEAATVFPGFTHLQSAQPVTFGHHLLAYEAMLARDCGRLRDGRARLNQCPLGAGALAGNTYGLDRQLTSSLLGFDAPMENSLDAVADRDYILEFLSAASIVMVHLSRLGEEVVLWMTPAFGLVMLPDELTTGSSIMPQKKNPDVAELVRAKSGRVFGALVTLLTVMKGQPLAYNRDNQEDKEPLFDTIDTLALVLPAAQAIIAGVRVNRERALALAASGYATATDLADHLVRCGVPFREAHERVGGLVRQCLEQGRTLEQLTNQELGEVLGVMDESLTGKVAVVGSLAARNHIGGTAPAQVHAAAQAALLRLRQEQGLDRAMQDDQPCG